MATITRFVNTASTAGGDGTTNGTSGATRAYASLSEFESNEQQDLTDAGGDIIDCICEGTAADTVTVNFSGWTTNANSYIQVRTTQANRHDGRFDTGKYRIVATATGGSQRTITISEDFVRIIGLQIDNIAGAFGSGNAGIRTTALGAGSILHISHNIVMSSDSNGGTGIDAEDPDSIHLIWNNVVHNFNSFNILAGNLHADSAIYANTVVNGGGTGIHCNNKTFNLKNNICNGNTTDYSNINNVNSAANISEDSSSPDVSFRTKVVVFENEAGDDFHLGSSDTEARENGTDLSSDAALNVTDDIDADTRSTTTPSPDIGADEFEAAAGGDGTDIPWQDLEVPQRERILVSAY